MGNCHFEGQRRRGGALVEREELDSANARKSWVSCICNSEEEDSKKALRDRKTNAESTKRHSDTGSDSSQVNEEEKSRTDKRLIEAVQRQEWKDVRKFAKIVDINSQDKMGCTALMWAIGKNNLEMVKFLVEEYEADVNLRDIKGDTALVMAAYNGHPLTVEYLVNDTNADVDIPGEDGLTALEWAERVHNDTVVMFLRDHKKQVFSSSIERDVMVVSMLHPTFLQALGVMPYEPVVESPSSATSGCAMWNPRNLHD
mmetsp:Transcript_32920/g.61229  ORF Transcript_32920/g.61229 Transcript_32920/m.61229 type:complete len:257 (-) Transcript_32920:251-1021(-)|eukprot:CAMPEP_0170171330 /NCGR_PEP_ID=MMETSP0040_2-20121228/4458_1 /TAXON_ID=641309 /ORGANISM="Lotharella oceanica, Strain CCMP622" /LENGTH=256 /DNA_ID=CAMNT_0010411309 /DNA_START=125 /DNA_END=895 /DNA_ORIENTATION=-